MAFAKDSGCTQASRAAVEGLPLRGHLAQQGRRAQVLAEQVGQPVGLGHESGQADTVDEETGRPWAG